MSSVNLNSIYVSGIQAISNCIWYCEQKDLEMPNDVFQAASLQCDTAIAPTQLLFNYAKTIPFHKAGALAGTDLPSSTNSPIARKIRSQIPLTFTNNFCTTYSNTWTCRHNTWRGNAQRSSKSICTYIFWICNICRDSGTCKRSSLMHRHCSWSLPRSQRD